MLWLLLLALTGVQAAWESDFQDPLLGGGSWLTKSGEPLNVVVNKFARTSRDALLTWICRYQCSRASRYCSVMASRIGCCERRQRGKAESSWADLERRCSSLGYQDECLGLHMGGPQEAHLGQSPALYAEVAPTAKAEKRGRRS